MASFLRSSLGHPAFLASVFSTVLLLGCGGKVGDEVDDGGADSASDAVPIDGDLPPDGEPIVDGGPSGCGWGSCTPGTGCSDGCNSCKCVADNLWECTGRYCPDAEPPPPPPCPYTRPADRTYCPIEGQSCTYPNSCGGVDYSYCSLGPEGRVWMTKSECVSSTCPTYLPPAGSYCSGFSKCGYKNSCGGVDTAACNGKYWDVAVGPCTTPSCPPSLPTSGAFCSGPLKCAYANSCGSYDTATCDGSSAYWRVFRGDCPPPPPPPPPTCPTTTPADGTACASGLSCSWNNGCGGINYGYCSSYGWSIKREGCSSTCPASKPTGGLACKTPGTTSCRYVVSPGSTCTTQCFCADDYRWACVTPPCAEPVPPSSDAGPGF